MDNAEAGQSRYDEKLEHILEGAANVFAEKGYHNASMRDVAKGTGVSLAGLYHYFGSKDELLYLIQDDVMGRLLAEIETSLEAARDPQERLRLLVETYLCFFLRNMAEMKVLAHEASSLDGEMAAHVVEKRRRLTALTMGMLKNLPGGSSASDPRVATFTLFGMLNWIYNWYTPDEDGDPAEVAQQMSSIFLKGYTGKNGTIAA